VSWRLTDARHAANPDIGDMDYTFVCDARTCMRRRVVVEYWGSIDKIFYRYNDAGRDSAQLRTAPPAMRDAVDAARAYIALTDSTDFVTEDLGI
jgi:hypothetical protein